MADFLATALPLYPAEFLPHWPDDLTGLCFCQELVQTDLRSEPVIVLST